jgi:CubicO group peptidase (beta-lactamase class C family)
MILSVVHPRVQVSIGTGLLAEPANVLAMDSPKRSGPTEDESLVAACEEALSSQAVPGFSLMIARDGETLFARGFGVRGTDDAVALDAATIFPIGSITKQFAATVAYLVAHDGLLDLDAPLARYVPTAPHAEAVTIRQLIVQTSGLANYTAEPDFVTTIACSTDVTPLALLEMIAAKPLLFEPGSRFEYSNTNYIALGAAIEAATGRTFAEELAGRITEPLGLASLGFAPPHGHANVVRTPWTAQATYAAGGLYASPADIVTWNEAFFSGRVVPHEVVTAMTTPPTFGDEPGLYACGWLVNTLEGRRMISHGGGVLGAHTINAWFPDLRMSVVAFGNALAFDPLALVRSVMRIVDPPAPEVLAELQAAERDESDDVRAEIIGIYNAWRANAVDMERYSDAMRNALTPDPIAALGRSLAALGDPRFIFKGRQPNGTGVTYRYRVETPKRTLMMTTTFAANGLIAGILFAPAS